VAMELAETVQAEMAPAVMELAETELAVMAPAVMELAETVQAVMEQVVTELAEMATAVTAQVAMVTEPAVAVAYQPLFNSSSLCSNKSSATSNLKIILIVKLSTITNNSPLFQ
jgi:hypothetical protein